MTSARAAGIASDMTRSARMKAFGVMQNLKE
jgi:hypothetical protein